MALWFALFSANVCIYPSLTRTTAKYCNIDISSKLNLPYNTIRQWLLKVKVWFNWNVIIQLLWLSGHFEMHWMETYVIAWPESLIFSQLSCMEKFFMPNNLWCVSWIVVIERTICVAGVYEDCCCMWYNILYYNPHGLQVLEPVMELYLVLDAYLFLCTSTYNSPHAFW